MTYLLALVVEIVSCSVACSFGGTVPEVGKHMYINKSIDISMLTEFLRAHQA